MFCVNSFISKDFADFENLFETSYQQPFLIKL